MLVTPNLLTYFSAGYTEAHFNSYNLLIVDRRARLAPRWPAYIGPGQTYSGYFLGAGDEYALSFLPGPVLEDRVSLLGSATPGPILRSHRRQPPSDRPFGNSTCTSTFTTIRSELVYRFNWGGPVVAKY